MEIHATKPVPDTVLPLCVVKRRANASGREYVAPQHSLRLGHGLKHHDTIHGPHNGQAGPGSIHPEPAPYLSKT